MADNNGGDNNNLFMYMGGNQRVPRDVRYVRVHQSVCTNLISIEMHDGVEIIEGGAFQTCPSLRGIKLPGVKVIEEEAFQRCTALENVEFGDKLETIGRAAFTGTALRNIKIPKVRFIGNVAFAGCKQLTEVELSEDLERIVGEAAFYTCIRLRRIVMPLKHNLFGNRVFSECDNLSQVEIVGGIHKTISSLLLNSWRNEMKDEIGRIEIFPTPIRRLQQSNDG